MPRKFIDRTGERVGRLTIIKPASINPTWFECLCDCGNVVKVRASSLRVRATNSCGCLHREIKTKHKLRHLPEYGIWKEIQAAELIEVAEIAEERAAQTEGAAQFALQNIATEIRIRAAERSGK